MTGLYGGWLHFTSAGGWLLQLMIIIVLLALAAELGRATR